MVTLQRGQESQGFWPSWCTWDFSWLAFISRLPRSSSPLLLSHQIFTAPQPSDALGMVLHLQCAVESPRGLGVTPVPQAWERFAAGRRICIFNNISGAAEATGAKTTCPELLIGRPRTEDIIQAETLVIYRWQGHQIKYRMLSSI